MKTKTHGDGSETHTYEVGDLVELIKDQHISGRVGEWGKVYKTSEPDSSIAFLDIQIAGYSRGVDSFFAATTSVPSWDVIPRVSKPRLAPHQYRSWMIHHYVEDKEQFIACNGGLVLRATTKEAIEDLIDREVG